jgi:hypothetical protein
MRVTFQLNDTIQVFRLGKTTNKKIALPTDKVLQTYTFSVDQFNYIKEKLESGVKPVFKEFFSLDSKNCFDCPFSMNQGKGGCYTHKVMQYSGFVSMLKSVVNEFGSLDSIPSFNEEIENKLVKMATGNYVRFGTYGEPSMHPIGLVDVMASVASSWTGYTHQYFRKPEYAKFFMASVHNAMQAKTAAERFKYRSFIAAKDNVQGAVKCPASKEAGFVSNCAKCGLCSGTSGKGKKDVVILEH